MFHLFHDDANFLFALFAAICPALTPDSKAPFKVAVAM